MQAVGNFISGMFDINQATLSGAIDVIVVEHEDGSLHCTPFHVRFGKFQVLRSREKIIQIRVNGRSCDLMMKLGGAGEAYFVEETTEELDDDSMASPIMSPELSPPMSPTTRELFEKLEPLAEEEKKNELVDRVDKPSRFQWIWGNLPRFSGIFGRGRSQEEVQKMIEEREEQDNEIDLSLCGHLLAETKDQKTVFMKHLVSFEDFATNPWWVLNDPRLVVRVEQTYYDWNSAVPIIISLLAFRKPLPAPEMEMPPMSPPSEKEDENLLSPDEPPRRYRKTLRLSSAQLKKLRLNYDANDITYRVVSTFQGEKTLHGKIYLWKYSNKIVISDIDGTITKSDVLGQILPKFGRDWSHAGVVGLYNAIITNGYKVLYLSSRAIGQAESTKSYLQQLNQSNQLLPPGPVLLSPDRLIQSFVREVVRKEPHKFKTGVLRDVARVFPKGVNPYYAGFGNRDTDAIAYRSVGVPMYRIFIINPEGELCMHNKTYKKSYPTLNELALEMFPYLRHEEADTAFSSLNYWKLPIEPLFDDDF